MRRNSSPQRMHGGGWSASIFIDGGTEVEHYTALLTCKLSRHLAELCEAKYCERVYRRTLGFDGSSVAATLRSGKSRFPLNLATRSDRDQSLLRVIYTGVRIFISFISARSLYLYRGLSSFFFAFIAICVPNFRIMHLPVSRSPLKCLCSSVLVLPL